jgi:hypothetical protein
MIKLIIGTAPEHVDVDGHKVDSWELVSARIALRNRAEDWNFSPEAANYPPMQIYRDAHYNNDMIAFMEFETEEEAALFKLTFSEIFSA